MEPPVAAPAPHDNASFLACITIPAPDYALDVGLDGEVLEDDRRRPLGRLPCKTGDENRGMVVGVPCHVISPVSGDWLCRESDGIVLARRKSRNRIEQPYQIGAAVYGRGPPCGWTTASCARAAGTQTASMGTFWAIKAFGKPRSRYPTCTVNP